MSAPGSFLFVVARDTGSSARADRSGGAGRSGGAADALVARATDQGLAAPDWGANMEVVDYGNTAGDRAQALASALARRLRSSNPAIVGHCIELVRACAKNGNAGMLRALGAGSSSGVTESLAGVAKPGAVSTVFARAPAWHKVEEEALRLIQELGQEFEGRLELCPAFHHTYASLVQQGVVFPIGAGPPAPPSSLAGDQSPGTGASHPARRETGGPRAVRDEEVEKLEHDMMMLGCKMDVADHLLSDQDLGLDSEEILDVLDFLQQCKPRMVQLIEASAMGLMSDSFLVEALRVNDRLCQTVDRLEGKAPRVESKPEPKLSLDRTGASSVPILRAPRLAALRKDSSGSGSHSPRATPTAPEIAPSLSLSEQGLGALEPPSSLSSTIDTALPSRACTQATAAANVPGGVNSFESNPFDFFAAQSDDDSVAQLVTQERRINNEAHDETSSFLQ